MLLRTTEDDMTTIQIQQIYGDDAHYVDNSSAAAIEGLPSDAWDSLVEACDKILLAGREPGIDCSVTKTYETIEDFDKSRAQYWPEKGSRTEHNILGRRAVFYEGFQLQRGQPRGDQVVIDLGDCRAVLMV